MKKTFLALILLFTASITAYAQWTTIGTAVTTPSYVGVGTSTIVSMFQLGSGFSKLNTGRANTVNLNNGTSYVGFNAGRSTDSSSPGWMVMARIMAAVLYTAMFLGISI